MATGKVVINSQIYDVALDKTQRHFLYSKTMEPVNGVTPAPAYLEWRVDGPDFNAVARKSAGVAGYLGRHYGVNTDGRWDGVDTLGPEISTIALDTYDATHAASLLGTSTAKLGNNFFLGGAIATPTVSEGVALAKLGNVWYAYIRRGQVMSKLKLSTMVLGRANLFAPADITDVVATKNPTTTNRREVSAALGESYSYRVVKESNVQDSGDTWVENSAAQTATKFGIAPDRTVLMIDKTVKGNIQVGSVTMTDPDWQTVATLGNEDMVFTGFVMDGNLWLLQTSRGPYYLDQDRGEFTPLMPEIDTSVENGRNAGRWFPVGAIIPLREGVRYSRALSGESWGVEQFTGNNSPVQGYPTAGDGSVKWYLQAVYNPVTLDTYLVAWRPRQSTDWNNPHPLTPFTIAKLTGIQSRWMEYLGTLDGARTLPTWLFGYGADKAAYISAGRTARWIDDTSYRRALTGTTYLTEVQFDQIADIEAFEFQTAHCAASQSVQIAVSLDRATAVTVGSAVVTNGQQRVLAVAAAIPQATALGGMFIQPEIRYSSNIATDSPQVLGWLRMRYRPRAKLVGVWRITVHLPEEDNGKGAADLQAALETAWGTSPVPFEDIDEQSGGYIRVRSVQVEETDRGAGGETSHLSTRVAHLILDEWQTAA